MHVSCIYLLCCFVPIQPSSPIYNIYIITYIYIYSYIYIFLIIYILYKYINIYIYISLSLQVATHLYTFIDPFNCQSIDLSIKSCPQEALEVPLGQEQTRRLLRTDRLTIALEDDVILTGKLLAMMRSGHKS